MYNDNNDTMPATMAVQLIWVIIDSKDDLMKPNILLQSHWMVPAQEERRWSPWRRVSRRNILIYTADTDINS
jgi:hypothetical protein